jgi:hypothetical protein
MSRSLRICYVLAALALWPSAAPAAPYQFELLAERPRFAVPFTSDVYKLPALNDNGTAALILPRSGSTPRDEVIYTGTPGNLRAVEAPAIRVLGGVSINNPGEVAFIGLPDAGGAFGIYRAAPVGPVVTISTNESFNDRHETAIADNGMVVFPTRPPIGFPNFIPGSLKMGDGSSPAQTLVSGRTESQGTQLSAGQMYRPGMSASGAWVVREAGGRIRILHSNHGIVSLDDGSGYWTTFGQGDVAGNGDVVFSGRRYNDATSKFYIDRDGQPLASLPGSDGLDGYVALNDDGVVALLGGGSTETQGTLLRLFRDGAIETVLAQGDPLLGSTVSSIGFDPKGFNNSEQFALLVGLADGRDVYVLASPVPEPAGIAATVVVAGLLALRRRR